MKIFYTFIPIFFLSCSTYKIDIERYELAYNQITEKTRDSKPFFKEFKSDASGTKIIANIYKYKGYYKDFISQNNFKKSKGLKKLSNKYSKKNHILNLLNFIMQKNG